MKLLVTGFLPFNHQDSNPSQLLVEKLGEDSSLSESVSTLILPVSYERAARALRDRLDADPSLSGVLMFGLAQQRERVSLERVAANWIESGIPDEDGARPSPGPFMPGCPPVFYNPLPLAEWVAEIQKMGIPAEVSLSAGGYVCNSTSFAVAEKLTGEGRGRPWLFVHVPLLSEPGGPFSLEALKSAAIFLIDMMADCRNF